MKKLLIVLFFIGFFTPLLSEMKYNVSTKRLFSVPASLAINQIEYHVLVGDVRNIIASARKTHKFVQNTIESRFGFKVNDFSQSGVPNSIKCVIINYLMTIGTPTAFRLLGDLSLVNYLF